MSVLSALLYAAMVLPGRSTVPYVTTETADLSPSGVEHGEVLRIDRDFGKPSFDIVVDAWRASTAPDNIVDVRMWWVETTQGDQRSPFGEKVHRYIELEYEPHGQDKWHVTLRGDRKEFGFEVAIDDAGQAIAITDVKTEDGLVSKCRATSGRLVARRLMGIPLGIKRLEITCVDAEGLEHRGELPYRKLRRGPTYDGA
jgi:hypothetical protein